MQGDSWHLDLSAPGGASEEPGQYLRVPGRDKAEQGSFVCPEAIIPQSSQPCRMPRMHGLPHDQWVKVILVAFIHTSQAVLLEHVTTRRNFT
jgi:hypothetical protein